MVFVPATGYTHYESAERSRPFSSSHIATLSIRDALNTVILYILPSGSVSVVRWSSEILKTKADLLYTLHENDFTIPHVDDLRPLLADQPSQFVNGMRSVEIKAHGMCYIFADSL